MVGPSGKSDYLKATVKPVRIHGSFSWLGWEDGNKSSLSGPITMWSHSPYPTNPGGGVSEQSLTESLTLHVFQLHKNPSWPLLEVTSWLYCLGNNEELSLAAEPRGALSMFLHKRTAAAAYRCLPTSQKSNFRPWRPTHLQH